MKAYKLKYFISMIVSPVYSEIWVRRIPISIQSNRCESSVFSISRFTYKIHSAKVKKYSNDGGYSVYGS